MFPVQYSEQLSARYQKTHLTFCQNWKLSKKSNLTTLLITIMNQNETLNKFLSNSCDHSVHNNFLAVILWFRSTLSIMEWSSCAVAFFGWPGLGLSLTLLVLWNLSLSLYIVVLWTQNVTAICTTSLPVENIPIAWFLCSRMSLGMIRLDHYHLIHTGNRWFTQQEQHSNLLKDDRTKLQSQFTHFVID